MRLGERESNSYQNLVTIADPNGDIYYTQYLHGGERSGASGGSNGHKDVVVENGDGRCGLIGRKDVLFSTESGGALMDDAMILPCGHSFGAAGIQHDKRTYGDSNIIDPLRGRVVQFPFAVTDQVIIKGNNRTPQGFVAREAIVTTQCLDGWYVLKTLENAESVKNCSITHVLKLQMIHSQSKCQAR
ncbi:hypothetical protein DITRI_Ditri20bG0121100 [Diplodiscus trichospermus]